MIHTIPDNRTFFILFLFCNATCYMWYHVSNTGCTVWATTFCLATNNHIWPWMTNRINANRCNIYSRYSCELVSYKVCTYICELENKISLENLFLHLLQRVSNVTYWYSNLQHVCLQQTSRLFKDKYWHATIYSQPCI